MLERTPPLVYPWSDELNEEVHGKTSASLCHRCFTPKEHPTECGAAAGPYDNVMPVIYIFSIGEVFRNGVARKKKPAAFVTAGYLILSVFEYVIFFPFYWYRFFKSRIMPDAEDEVDAGEQTDQT